jgi:dTDP-4-dehydrorhamnose 3,5-epimerase-like enzyme
LASLINLKTFTDTRGNLTVIEKVVPFDIKRIFYIYGVDNSERGGHRHFQTQQAAICIRGNCCIYSDNGIEESSFILDSPDKCLLIQPEDWHSMSNFSEDAILMVLASAYFEASDYIYAPYSYEYDRV